LCILPIAQDVLIRVLLWELWLAFLLVLLLALLWELWLALLLGLQPELPVQPELRLEMQPEEERPGLDLLGFQSRERSLWYLTR
jgi:hypothetical protein